MDEEVDSDDENVNSVLVQVSSQLFQILSQQSLSVIMELCKMMPSDSGWQNQLASTAAGTTEHITAMLEYFRAAPAADCRNFLQSVCLLCENMPMHLESMLISVAGYSSMDAVQPPAIEFETNMNTGVYEHTSSSVTYENSSPPEQLIKRPRIDHWEQYIAAVRSLMLRRWERLTERLVTEIQLESVWVSLRTAKGGRDRPDQTPGSADRGSRTPESDGDYGCLESRLTLETFLQGCAGKVTVLVGPAGSGKTLLMSCLGQQWAKGLGPIPSSYMFILLEFRQLNLLSRPLSLYELLFQHYLPPQGGDDAKRDIVKYLLTNPEQCCCVLDGYDEFHHKLRKQEAKKEQLDSENPLPVSDLISGLLNRQLLPGSTVLVTCRARDVVDLESVSDKIGQLLVWSRHQISEYVNNYFGKGHSANRVLGQQAVDLLHSSRHLLAMSSLPALCSICCTCLEYLLLEGRDAGGMQRGPDERKEEEDSEGDTQREEQRTQTENCEILGGTNGKAPTSTYLAQVPVTLTQVYLTVLAALLSRDPDHGESDDKAKTTHFTQSPACTLTCLCQHHSELRELSRLAWRGLEDGKILFVEEEIPQDVLKFSIRTGLFSQVELRRQDGRLVNAYCFIHLTVQEFLAALRIMTSKDISDMQLKKGFSLKTRWTTKSDQKTAFTDSLYLYVCGLASPHCTRVLTHLAKANGETGVQRWVEKRQALILKFLNKLCLSNTLTGPKILELCHCVQESQNKELAKQVMRARPILELRNIWLLPNDIDALAFVVNSGGNGTGLDFGACSMDLECLDDLCRCQNIHSLSFHGRKYGDKFAEKLSSVLQEFTALRKLEFCSASLTAAGAASLASGLQSCPGITVINLNDNNLRDEGIGHIVEIFPKLQKLESVMMGRNNTSLKAVVCLLEKTSSCSKICHVHADGMKEVTITFSQNPDTNSNKPTPGPTISLLNQKWTRSEVQKVGKSLTRCPALSVLDLSGDQWDEETLRTLTRFLPKMNITEKIIVNDSCSSVDSLVILTALLCDCPPVRELHVRLQSPAQAFIVFSGGREKPANERSKTLCLSCCNLVPANLESVWRSLGTSELTLLDLSRNSLGNKGLKKLLDLLPHLNNIQEINASNNDISMEGAVMLAGALCSHDNLTHITVSDGGKDQVILRFCNKSDDKQNLKTFRMTNSSLQPSHITDVCGRLTKCRSHLDLEFCHSSLTDRAIKNLLKVLAKMTSLQRLNLSYSITSTTDALMLISCLIDNQQVTSLELRPECESIINFQEDKADQVSCRLTHFCLNGDNMERLLEILQQVPCLSYLDLSNSQLEDEGVKHLVDFLPKLNISNYINLSNTQLSKQGLLDLSSTLCSCTRVSGVEVSLGQEDHGDEVRCLIWFMQNGVCEKTLSVKKSNLECGHLVRLAQILSSCPTLAKLELKNNLLQSEWVEDFVKLFNSSQRGCAISIEEDWISAEKAVHLVCRCLDLEKNIQTIMVHHNTLHLYLKSAELTLFSADSTDPAQSVGTEKIGFVDCAVDDYQLASMRSIVQRCPKLTQLDFSLNSLGVEGAECLCSFVPMLPNLSALSLASKERSVTVTVAEKISQALLQSTSVKCLILSGHIISDPAAQRLAALLPRLQSLNLSHCVWSMAGGLQVIEALAQCVDLEELCLDSVQLNEESKTCLAQTLRNISLTRRLRLNEIVPTIGQSESNSMVDLLAAMEGLTQIEEIELNNWGMADRGTEELTRLLPIWKELRKISLSKNLISDQSGEKLLEALGSCSQLEELHLCRNNLGDLTAARIALVLPSLTHLKVLDLSENHIGNKGSVSLSNAVMCMKNLNKIHLTSVGTSELHAVVASLACCPFIKDVGLGWNNCGDEVALELARILPLCHKLTRIDLESNSVSALGAEALIRALRSCPALHVIRLWRNKVSQSEAQSLRQRDRRLNFSPT